MEQQINSCPPIELKDARVGSAVICPDKDNSVGILSAHSIKQLIDGEREFLSIPITDQWMEILGFVRSAYGTDWWCHSAHPNYCWYLYNGGLAYVGYYNGHGSVCGSGNKTLKFVHEIQTAFYIITGKELQWV